MNDELMPYLSDLDVGTCALIEDVDSRKELDRLKSMGICIGRKVEVAKRGDPLILKVYGIRIGLSARLARHIQVRPCESAPRCWERLERPS